MPPKADLVGEVDLRWIDVYSLRGEARFDLVRGNMKMFACFGRLFLFVLMILPQAVAAQSLKETLIRFGLQGNWAVNCHTQASPDNDHATFVMTSDDKARSTFKFGPKYDPFVNTIVSAQLIDGDPSQIRLKQFTNFNETEELIIRIKEGKFQTFYKISNGKILVKDGTTAMNGREAFWHERCN